MNRRIAVIAAAAVVMAGVWLAGAEAQPGPANTSRICIYKYEDRNGNRLRDSGEPLLPGWSFTLQAPGGPLISTTTTREGAVCVRVKPGTYKVTELLMGGWVNTDPGTTPPAKMVTVAPGATVNVVFGNRRKAAP